VSASMTFKDRLLAVLLPTRAQLLWSLVLALGILVLSQSEPILNRLGITGSAITTVQQQFESHSAVVLRSYLLSQAAVVVFWAAVGLVAYLLCWGAYNVLIEARNEVTLNTAYTNRGHWRGPWQTLGLKMIAAIGLILSIAALPPGLSLWILKGSEFLLTFSPASVAWAIGSIVGCAIQLYLILAFIQLTFEPWYRAETFTEG
jgi:hypothetical protein